VNDAEVMRPALAASREAGVDFEEDAYLREPESRAELAVRDLEALVG